jgi:plastocyanin
MLSNSWRSLLVLAGVLALVSAGGLSAFVSPVAAATHEVQIVDSAFGTPVLTIQVGDTVTWNNVDDRPHTVTSEDGAFDSGNLDEGASFSHTFTEPGTYPYVCEYHPDMRATIVVEAASAPSGSRARRVAPKITPPVPETSPIPRCRSRARCRPRLCCCLGSASLSWRSVWCHGGAPVPSPPCGRPAGGAASWS